MCFSIMANRYKSILQEASTTDVRSSLKMLFEYMFSSAILAKSNNKSKF